MRRDDVMVYGRERGRRALEAGTLDVGVDFWTYRPVHFDEVPARLARLE